MNKKPFEDLKVIDFTWGGVGPFQANFLSYFGAMVVRVESSSRPDVTRGSGGPRQNDGGDLERGPVFAHTHPTKKYGISLNLNTPQGLEIFKKLVAWADVLIESFTTGTLEKRGLGYEDLKKINPRIIMQRTCGYGHTGAMASHPGFGQTVTSLTGFYNITGWPDRKSVPISSFYTDHLAPLGGGLALISAINYQRRTGKGQCIDQSQVETGINFLSPVILEYTVNGRSWPLTGNQNVRAAPHGAYPCKGLDRWVAIGVYSDQEWESLCKILENPAWSKLDKFATLDGRVKHSQELDKHLAEWTLKFTNEQVMAVLQGAGIPAGVVANAQDSEEDPQLKAYDFYREMEHPFLGKKNFYHPPGFTLSEAPARLNRPTLLGEFNQYICVDVLGIPQAEFEQMQKTGVFD